MAKKGTTFLGLQLDEDLSTYITLYALAHSTNKTKITNEALFNWRKVQEHGSQSIENLLELMIVRFQKEWLQKKRKIPKTVPISEIKSQYKFFIVDLESYLHHRIKKATIEKIIEAVYL